MAVPNASALAAVGGSDTGGGTTEVSAAQGGEGAAAPGASLSEADEGGEQESGDAVEPAKETAEAPAAGAQALSAEAEEQEVPEAEVPDAGGTAYGAMEAGEAWDGTTHDVSWYNAADTSFTITTAAQLAGLADITSPRNDYAAWQAGLRESRAAGITQDNFKGKTIVLGADIDMGGKRFDPISDINNWGGGGQGTSDGTYGEVAWQGTFDGAGHVVKNLKVDGSVNCSNNFGGYQGLISAIGIGGKVKTLGVTGTLKGRVVGGIVGCSNTDMGSGTSATLTMSMAEWPTIENCWTDVEIIGNGSGSRGCGGIFGGESEYRAACNIVNCYARGTVKNTQAGGVTGSTNGIVAGCYNTGSVSGSYTGSIVSTLFMPTGTTAQYKAVGFYGNNMALKGTNANVWRKGVTLTSNPEEVTDGFVTSDELKAGASTLGSGYLADENNANNGYPLLFWQAGGMYLSIESAIIDPIDPQSFTGAAVEPTLTVKLDGKTLAQGSDYYVVYENNVNPGENTASVTAYGIGRYEGKTATVNFSIKQLDLSKCTIDPLANQWSYGESEPATPALTVKDTEGNTLAAGTDYTVEYSNNVETGKATAKVVPASDGTTGSISVDFFVVKAASGIQGSGTAEDPYLISSKGELQFVAHQVALGNAAYLSGEFKIANDFSAAAQNEQDLAADPLGWQKYDAAAGAMVYNYFAGNIDGDGHTITLGVSDNPDGTRTVALIAHAGISTESRNPTKHQTIKNLTIDGTVAGSTAAGFVATCYGTILDFSNCTNKATIGNKETDYKLTPSSAAGIAAQNHYGSFKNCKNEGTIKSGYAYSSYFGGIVAYSNSTSHPDWTLTFEDCTNTGSFDVVGGAVGGILGQDQNQSLRTYVRCYNTADITSKGAVGGIAGQYGTYGGSFPVVMDACFNTGNIASTANCAGGLLGTAAYGDTIITNCYNTGAVSTAATGANYGAGGMIGGDTVGSSAKAARDVTVSGYNVGAITATQAGGAIGVIKSQSRTTPTTYHLSTVYVSQEGITAGIGANQSAAYDVSVVNDNTQSVSTDALKAVPASLGSAFVADSAPQVNAGYPALYWQKGVQSKDLSVAAVSAIADQTYTGSLLRPSYEVRMGETVLVEGQDFTAAYADNLNVGTASITFTGCGLYTGELKATFNIVPQSIDGATVADIPDMWTSATIPAQPPLTVTSEKGVALVAGTDYTAAYAHNAVTGEATVTVTGTGNYAGSVQATYNVVATATTELEGAGTTADPYLIRSADDLEFMALAVNNQVGTYGYAAYRLTADIDATAQDGRPAVDVIGFSAATTSSGTSSVAFSGIFDGAGRTITLGLQSAGREIGLFGTVANVAVSNLTVAGSVTSDTKNAAGIAAYASGEATFENCVNEAAVSSGINGAGILARSAGTAITITIKNCVNKGDLSAAQYAGGMVGYLYNGVSSVIENCSNSGTITGNTKNTNYAGGIVGTVGTNNGSHAWSNLSNTASITAGYVAGGIVGGVTAGKSLTLANAYNTGAIAVTNSTTSGYNVGGAGGIIGCQAASPSVPSIANAYNVGAVSCNSDGCAGAVLGSTRYANCRLAVDNVYYLAGAADGAYGMLKSEEAVEGASGAKSDAELKAMGAEGMAALLGSAFADDTANANGGYPVFAQSTAASSLGIATIPVQTYTGSAIEPAVRVLDTSFAPAKVLSEGADYLLAYQDNVKAGIASVTAIGQGDYAGGAATTTFEIARAQLSDCAVAPVSAQVADPAGVRPELVVSSSTGYELKQDVDYRVFFYNNKEIGTATYVVLGVGGYEGVLSGTFALVGKSIDGAEVVMPSKVYCTGEALSVAPASVSVDGEILELGVDYEVVGYTDAGGNPVSEVKDKGTYGIVLRGIGACTGEAKASFDIVPYLSVYQKVDGGDKELLAEFTEAELADMAKEGSASSLYKGKAGWSVSTATSYVELASLFKKAGVEEGYAEGANVEFASGGFAVSQTYAELEGGKFYPATKADAIDESLTGDAVPAALALKEASSVIEVGKTAADAAAANAAAADGKNAPRVVVGAGEEAYKAGSVAGRRLVSGVDSVTISYNSPVVLKVQVLYAGSDTPKVVKSYTEKDLWSIQSEGDPVSGMFWKGDVWRVATTSEYVTFDDLFADAGIGGLWGSGAELLWGGDDPNSPEKASQKISYDTLMKRCWFFPGANGGNSDDPDNKVPAPPVLSLTEYSCATGDASVPTAADAEKYNVEHKNTKNFPRNIWGIPENEYTTDKSLARGMYYWSNNSYLTIKTDQEDPDKPEPATVERVAGDGAAETAAAIAAAAWGEGGRSEWAVLARDDDFADAMSATGLAGALGAPIVLTDRNGLSEAARATLESLGVGSVYVVGGRGAMPGDFEAELGAMGVAAERVFGDESWDTSVACARKIAAHEGSSEYAVVATSLNFQDALSMSSFAYRYRAPILLQTSEGSSAERRLTAEAQALLVGAGPFAGARVVVAGGPGAVSEESMGFLGRDYERLWGYTGYDTSDAVARYMVGRGLLSASTACVASGAQEARGLDALAGAALAGRAGGVMLLASAQPAMEAEDYTAVDGFLADAAADVRSAYVLGGAYVMPEAAVDRVRGALGVE